MEAAEARRAVAAAMSVAAALGLAVDDAVVLNNSNRLVARLLPCDIVARVSPMGWFSAAREVELARRLAEETDGPVAGLDPRVEPRIVARDGFEIAMWTYFEPAQSRELPPGDYADALERLHGALRRVDMSAPHFTDRLAEIQRWLADGDATPDLADETGSSSSTGSRPRGGCSPTAVPPSSCCTASRTRGTCSPRRTDCSSSTSRTAPAGQSSSTLRGFPTRSASAIGTLTRSWSASAGPSYWRSSQRTAGVETTNTRAADSQALRSSTSCGRVRRGRHSTPFIGSAQPKESRDRRTWARRCTDPEGSGK